MCDFDKPLFQCTLGEFAEAIAAKLRVEPPQSDNTMPLMFKGIRGIMQIFHFGKYSAIKIKDSHVIDEAIVKLGKRTFLVDPEKAIELYSQSKENEL